MEVELLFKKEEAVKLTAYHESENYQDLFDYFIYYFHKKAFISLEGQAGSGKTTFIKNVIASFYNYKVLFTATTNKAKSLFPKIEELYDVNTPGGKAQHELAKKNFAFSTIQGAIGLKQIINEEGEIELVPTGNGILSQSLYDLIVIDEASMVSEAMYQFIKGYKGKCSILVVGDSNQLPAVEKEGGYKETVFSIFEKADVRLTLQKNKRAINPELNKICNEIKNVIDDLKKNKEKSQYANFKINQYLMEKIYESREAMDFIGMEEAKQKGKANSIPFINYSNKGGEFFWLAQHGHYYIEGQEYYAKGITCNGLKKDTTYKILKAENQYLLIDGKEVKYKIAEAECTKTKEKKRLLLANPKEYEIFKREKRKIRLAKKKIKEQANLLSLFEQDNADLLQVKSNEHLLPYDIKTCKIIMNINMLTPANVYTVHASQGQTMDKVIFELSSLYYTGKNKEKLSTLYMLQLFYVAISRARQYVYIVP